jgi:hypothetical protein
MHEAVTFLSFHINDTRRETFTFHILYEEILF